MLPPPEALGALAMDMKVDRRPCPNTPNLYGYRGRRSVILTGIQQSGHPWYHVWNDKGKYRRNLSSQTWVLFISPHGKRCVWGRWGGCWHSASKTYIQYHSAIKKVMKYWYMLQHERISKTYRRSPVVWFPLYEISRLGKYIKKAEAESRLVSARG